MFYLELVGDLILSRNLWFCLQIVFFFSARPTGTVSSAVHSDSYCEKMRRDNVRLLERLKRERALRRRVSAALTTMFNMNNELKTVRDQLIAANRGTLQVLERARCEICASAERLAKCQRDRNLYRDKYNELGDSALKLSEKLAEVKDENAALKTLCIRFGVRPHVNI